MRVCVCVRVFFCAGIVRASVRACWHASFLSCDPRYFSTFFTCYVFFLCRAAAAAAFCTTGDVMTLARSRYTGVCVDADDDDDANHMLIARFFGGVRLTLVGVCVCAN